MIFEKKRQDLWRFEIWEGHFTVSQKINIWQNQEIHFSEKQTLFSIHISNFVFYLFRIDWIDRIKNLSGILNKFAIAKRQGWRFDWRGYDWRHGVKWGW